MSKTMTGNVLDRNTPASEREDAENLPFGTSPVKKNRSQDNHIFGKIEKQSVEINEENKSEKQEINSRVVDSERPVNHIFEEPKREGLTEQPQLFLEDESQASENIQPGRMDEWKFILEDLSAEKRTFELGQSIEPVRSRVSWETYLVLQLFGKVAYLTENQVVRFLEAWRKNIDTELQFKSTIIHSLIKLGWVEQIDKPLEFRKGVLKGKTIQPYYLTAKGFKFLNFHDPATARLARYGKPKEKMRERLRHETLISEVYIHLFELGHYVLLILPEEELRRERIQAFLRMKMGRDLPKTNYQSIGDFRILYFDKNTNRIINRDGEVAVRYTRDQILNKCGDLWWFCYDVVEAEKIQYITGQTPVILSEKIFGSEEKRERKSKIYVVESKNILDEWLEKLGGLTMQSAAYLAGIHYNTAKKILESKSYLVSKFTSLRPGTGNGRGIKLFVEESISRDPKAHHEVLVKNMTIQYLYENGFKVTYTDGELAATNVKENENHTLIFDAAYYRMGDQWKDVIESKRQEIERIKSRGGKPMLAVGESGNAEVFKKKLPDCLIISLSEYEFSYRR